jgi:hypothetical protein
MKKSAQLDRQEASGRVEQVDRQYSRLKVIQ